MKARLFLFLFSVLGLASQSFSQVTASFVTTPTTACINDPIQVTDQSSGGGPFSYTYSASDGQTSFLPGPVFTFTASGTYTISLNINDGTNQSQYSRTVEISPLPAVAISGNTAVCIGSAVMLTATGADTFTWSTVSNNSLVAVNPTATSIYTVTGTNTLTGCVNSQTFEVVVNSLPVISAANGTICSGNSFTISPVGAVSYTYSGGTSVVSPLSGSTYTVIGEDANGCLDTTQVNVTVNSLPVISVNSGSICAGESFTITSSGASTYTFSGGSAVVSPVVSTSYSVTGTDLNGCISASAAVSDVTVNALPVISVNSGSICAGDSFTMVPSGAATYTFSNGSAVVTPVANASYSVTGTSAEGCLSSNVAVSNITVNAVPVVSVNSGSICAGQSFTMTPSGAATYTFSNGFAVVNPVNTTSYSLTGTSAEGCVSSNVAVATVTVNAVPVVSVTSGTICAGQSFTIVPSGAATYTFSGGSAVVSPSVTTSYSVTGTSTEGCVSSNVAVSAVTVNALPVISVNSGSICAGQSFTMSPSGAASYTFSGGSSVVSPASSSSYSVIGTSAAGCLSSNTAVSDVTVNTVPVVSVNSGSICAGQSFTMTPSGASTYTFSNGFAVVNPASTTSYSVAGTSAEGCLASNVAISTVTVNALPVISVNSGSVCAGQSFTITPSGASTYTFSGGSSVITPTATASYSVTGTSPEGCVSAVAAVSSVTVNALPVLSVNSGSICAGQTFTMVPTGASSYSFSGGSATVSPATTTSYTINGTSAQGCVASAAVVSTVTVNSLPVISVNSGSICAGQVFTMVPSGASTYTFSNGSSTVNPATTTSYSVTGTAANGCASSAAAVSTVTVNALPVISVNSGSVCAGQTFTLIPSGATTYTFSNGSATVNPGTTSSYSVTGTGANGCVSSSPAVATVTVNALPVISVNSGSICTGQTFTMLPSGASTYTFSGGSATVSPSTTTSYSVTGTGANGCVSAAPAVAAVTVNALPVIVVNSGSICAGQAFTLAPSGAVSYTFSNGSATVNPVVTTSYSVTGTGSTGCVSGVAVATVTVYSLPAITLSTNTLICNGSTASITAAGAVTYTWINTSVTSSVLAVTPSVNTTYTALGANANGCVGMNTVTVVVDPLPTVTVNGGAICPGNSFTISPAGANVYTISSSAGSYTFTGTAVVTPTATSIYTVGGTSASGCNAASPAVATVSVVNTLTVSITGTTSVCMGQSATLTASGASSYSWSTGAQTSTIVLSPAASGTYAVLGVSGTCSNVATSSITVNPLPVVTANSGSVCAGQQFIITPTGALSYVYSGSSATVTPSATTSYSVYGTDGNGCTSTLAAVSNVTVNPNPTVTVNSGSVCAGQQFVIVPSGAITYTISGGSATVTPSASGSYSVTGTDSNGCVSQPAISSVSVQALPVITITAPHDTICAGESIVLTADGASSYTWSNAQTTASISVTPSVNASYNVTGSDGTCISTAGKSIVVSVCAGLEEVANVFTAVYPNPSSGEYFVSVSDDVDIKVVNSVGQLVFTRSLSRGVNSLGLSELPNGIYFVYSKGGGTPAKLIKQ